MGTLQNREEIKRNTDEDPDIKRLKDDFNTTIADLGPYFNQTSCNYDTRNEFWPNQDLRTGRKPKGTLNDPAYPWDDASDIRTFTSDTIIKENSALLVKSLLRGNLTALPVEGNDIERAQMISQFTKWMLTQVDDIDRQARILASYQEERAIGLIGTFWDTKVEEVMKDISLEEIANINPEQPEVGIQLVELILDPDTTKEATDIMISFFPTVSRRRARKMVNELRKEGTTSVGVPEIIHNKPIMKALSVDEDVFFQSNIIDIQDAPYIFHAVYMTPEQLRANVKVEEWDEKWVDEAIANTVGQKSSSLTNTNRNTAQSASNRFLKNNILDESGGYVRVIFAYEKATTEDGVPGVFITAFHPDVEGWGMSKLLDYKPARYPFVAFTSEVRSNRLLDSRGVPERAKGLQDEIKVQQDSRVNRTHLSTCPPREHPLGRKPSNWGPGDSLGVRRKGEYGFVEAPTGDIGDSVEIEQSIRNNMNRMFGRPVPGEDPQHAIDILQDMVDMWLRSWKKVMDQMWDLYQQFGADETFFRVIGSNNVEAMQFIKSEGHERVDFYLDYGVINADAALLLDKLVKVGEVAAQHDKTGAFDFDEWLRAIAGAVDSSYPDRFIKPQQKATEEEIRKTQDDIAKIASGQAVNAPENANTQLRMQVLEQYVQGTEEIPALDVQQRMQEDEAFQARIQKYIQQLQFQDTQRQNALIGKLGTEPGNAAPSA